MTAALTVSGLNKHFLNGRHALKDIHLEVAPGEMIALIGASGSGKSTLMRHLSGLLKADVRSGGSVLIHGKPVQVDGKLSRDIRAIRSQVGYVFQQFNLVGRLPLVTNVMIGALHRMPAWRSLTRCFSTEEKARAEQALARVGLSDMLWQRASTLSGGQQQRAAIARTLVQGARMVLADEPIASLDPESSRRVMDILKDVNRTERCTVIVSLHQIDVALAYCPRVVALNEGEIVYDGPASALTPALLRTLYNGVAPELEPDADALGATGTGPAHLPARPSPEFNSLAAQAA